LFYKRPVKIFKSNIKALIFYSNKLFFLLYFNNDALILISKIIFSCKSSFKSRWTTDSTFITTRNTTFKYGKNLLIFSIKKQWFFQI